ncbi:DUF4003 family protein [Bacillus massilioanorexius]|nr:DUF4003 family protein [Bacillus massilioanorexius]
MNTMLDLFLENEKQIKKAFRFENQLVQKFAALQIALQNQTVDIEKAKEMMEYVKKETSAFSYFRSNNLLPISIALSLHSNGFEVFQLTQKYYEDLKKAGFKRSHNLPFMAYFLATEVDNNDVSMIIERALDFYQKMKEEHVWLTSSEDYMNALILAHSHSDVSLAIHEIEKCYDYLNNQGLRKGNTLQAISHLLSLSNDSHSNKCDRLLQYEALLKENKISLNSYSKTLLGILAILEVQPESIVNEMMKVDDQLSKQKGFGNFSLGKANRSLFTIAIVSAPYLRAESAQTLNSTIQNSIQSIILAEQAAIIASISAATAASNSGSSSN